MSAFPYVSKHVYITIGTLYVSVIVYCYNPSNIFSDCKLNNAGSSHENNKKHIENILRIVRSKYYIFEKSFSTKCFETQIHQYSFALDLNKEYSCLKNVLLLEMTGSFKLKFYVNIFNCQAEQKSILAGSNHNI